MAKVPDNLIDWASDNVSKRAQQKKIKEALVKEYENILKGISQLLSMYDDLIEKNE